MKHSTLNKVLRTVFSVRGLVFLLFFIFVALPFLFPWLSSFFHEGKPTLRHYAEILDAGLIKALARSLKLSVLATLIASALGLPAAVLLARCSFRGKFVYLLLVILPLLIPPYVMGYIWLDLFGNFGPINSVLLRIFPSWERGIAIYGLWGSAWVLALSYYPCIALIVASRLQSVDHDLEEEALLHAGGWGALVRVLIPSIAPTVGAAACLVFLLSMSNYAVPSLLVYQGVYPAEIFARFQGTFDVSVAAAAALPFAACVILLILIAWFFFRRGTFESAPGYGPVPEKLRIRKGRCLLTVFCLICVLVSSVLPLAVLINGAGSPRVFGEVYRLCMEQIGHTMILGLASATVATLLAIFAGYFSARSLFPERTVEMLAVLPFLFPGALVGIGLIGMFNRPGPLGWVYGSFLIMVIGYCARFFYVPWKVSTAVFRQLDPELEEMAMTLGVSRWRVVHRVCLPLCMGSILPAWLLTFILCMGEVATTVLIYPPHLETISIRTFNFMHYGRDSVVMALCLVVVAVNVAAVAIFFIARRLYRRFQP